MLLRFKEGVEKEMSVIKLKGGKVTEKEKEKVMVRKINYFQQVTGMNVIKFVGEKFNMILIISILLQKTILIIFKWW